MARFQQTFPAPKGVREFKEIVIQDVTGKEERVAGRFADDKAKRFGGEWSPLIELVKLSIEKAQ